MAAIEVQDLKKRYGRTEALRGVSLSVPEGGLFGLLGPNGAGKTTLIRTLVGSLRPTGGSVRVLGLEPLRQRWQLRQQIGYMPQSPALYEDLSARDNIAFFGAAHMSQGLSKRVEEVLQLTALTDRADYPVHTLSGGMKNRVSLAAALVHQPRILFLDEPTAGLDPYLRARLWELFKRLASEGTTILISTHLMDEAMLCDRVAILMEGKVVADAPPRKLVEHSGTRLQVREHGRIQDELIGGSPEALAEALRPYGLRSSVEAIDVRPASLEDVMLSLHSQEVKQ